MPPKANRVMGCPACSYRVTGREQACPRCGKKFDKNTKFECPFCGAQISKKAKRCPSCQIDLLSIQVKHEATDSDKLKNDERRPLLDDDKRFVCPGCAASLDGTEKECPKCGRALSGKLGLQCPLCGTSVDLEFRECPICGISLESALRKPGPVIRTDLADTHPCPFCGAIIPNGLENCPLCKTNFAAPAPPQVPEMVPDEKAETISEAETADAGKIVAAAAKPVRQLRKLKAKVTTAPVSVQTGAVRGRTNGIGQINGLGKINGTGAVNGRAFVNGTGAPGGTGSKPSKAAQHRTFLTRWQFLAVLIVVIVLIPTFMFFAYSGEGSKYSVDGEFEEWSDARTLGSRIWSTASSSNVTEWAVAAEGSDLFMYAKTQQPMMAATDPEGLYLFIDSDGLSGTGYVMESIGADYMLRLVGWNGTVSSADLLGYAAADQYDWNSWMSKGSASVRLDANRIEAGASMPVSIGEAARFVLVSTDAAERGSVSCTAPLKGGVLVVEQSTAPSASTGIVQSGGSVAILQLKFTCHGEGGDITSIAPQVEGAILAQAVETFSISKGSTVERTVYVNTMGMAYGELVSAKISALGITSSFAAVEVVGYGAKAQVGVSGPTIIIDGAFADWTGRLSLDQDATPVTDRNLDISAVGNVSDSSDSFFYVSVVGELCSGSFVPATIGKASVAGGGGTVVPPRHTAEDVLAIYIDSDKSDSTGKIVTMDTKIVGADQMILVKGLFGVITSAKEFEYSASNTAWVESSETVDAAKDQKRIEIGVTAASLGGHTDIDFIVETTSWKGRHDLATYDPALSASTRTWVVEPAVASPYATSMSYQRKMFYDGINYWSFYFDGSDTVHKYSMDDGQTWTYCGPVFVTAGVNETSIWYDEPTMTVFAVGDVAASTSSVSVQAGVVDPAAHSISWAATDSNVNVSKFPTGGKNSYISRDASGHLWILSSSCVQAAPATYQLSAYMSSAVNDIRTWTFTGDMLTLPAGTNNVKGSIVPAGKGSDVWAVYAWAGNVASSKFTGTWQPQQMVYTQAGSKAPTDNSPPSVVVDGKGVVHVVYGNGRRAGLTSVPSIEWSHNFTGQTNFTLGVAIDPIIIPGSGNYYPTISLDELTGNLYAFWLRTDTLIQSSAVIGKKHNSTGWSDLTIEQQTAFPKMFLTSVYSVHGLSRMCWQWTENTTAPVNVLFDGPVVPEFGDLAPPLAGLVALFVVFTRAPRRRKACD